VKIFEVGDGAFCVEFGPKIDLKTNQNAIGLASHLERMNWPGIQEVVPAYSSVTIYFNPLNINRLELTAELLKIVNSRPAEKSENPKVHRVPVAYGAECGPDLEGVARLNGIPAAAVVKEHTGIEFRVFMLGFMPGFPYCGIVPPKIRAPRLSSPRTRVPAGSVGIAGAQTGIYPMESPGGWQLIGRTPLTLFDPTAGEERMFRFAPGDYIRFYSISAEEFHEWKN